MNTFFREISISRKSVNFSENFRTSFCEKKNLLRSPIGFNRPCHLTSTSAVDDYDAVGESWDFSQNECLLKHMCENPGGKGYGSPSADAMHRYFYNSNTNRGIVLTLNEFRLSFLCKLYTSG